MKQKDLLVLVAVAIFGIIMALVLSNFFLVTPKSKAIEVEKIDKISAEFDTESVKKYINDKAVNPSETIEVGKTNNTDPF